MKRKTTMLRELLSKDGMIVAPGCYDSLSAVIAQSHGFPLVYMSGCAASGAMLGKPDIGLASMSEVLTNARNISGAVDIPLISDADTGYGNALNVWRTVREFEKAGVAGIHLEDQKTPKKCGLMEGRAVAPKEEMVGKIKAALDAREDKDFVIIARSDAKYMGLDEVADRLNAYADAGADLVMVTERYLPKELEYLISKLRGRLFTCPTEGQPEYAFSVEQYERMGIKLLLYPIAAFLAVARKISEVYGLLKEGKGLSLEYMENNLMDFEDFNRLVGLPDWQKKGELYKS
jgi:2,3-dimethylmalate lyase